MKPGTLEVIFGPMKSQKSSYLKGEIDKLRYKEGTELYVFKPSADTRSDGIYIRGKKTIPAISVDKPQDILQHIQFGNKNDLWHGVVTLDEVQLFPAGSGIELVVDGLLAQGFHVKIAGLNLDFRGEPFGAMGPLIARADIITPRTGYCDFDGCNAVSTRTQRLFKHKPVPYDSPITVIDKSQKGITYESRCPEHHFVPGKPGIILRAEIRIPSDIPPDAKPID